MRLVSKIMARIRGEEPTSKLIKKGLVVGGNFYRGKGVVIDSAHCWLIHIGNNVSLAPFVHILAHDAAPQQALGYTRIGRVEIGNNVLVGTHAIIMPGVKIGNKVGIAAGSLVVRDIPDNSVVAGNPARRVGTYDERVELFKQEMETVPIYDEKWTLRGGITPEMKQKMYEDLGRGFGYVR